MKVSTRPLDHRIFRNAFSIRKKLFQNHEPSVEAMRLYDEDALPGFTHGIPLVVEVFSGHAFCVWREESALPIGLVEALCQSYESVFEASLHSMSCVVRPKANLKFDPERDVLHLFGELPSDGKLKVKEHGITYEIRLRGHAHPGLFLDHREFRKKLVSHFGTEASAVQVCNLFCFTGSLGIAALVGGAVQVDQVDLSAPNLDWARANFQHSLLSGSIRADQNMNFFNQDSEFYLKKTLKKVKEDPSLRFDWILCDPPSFARKKDGSTFHVKKNHLSLVQSMVKLLNMKGRIMFSCNYDELSMREMERILRDVVKQESRKLVSFEELAATPGEFVGRKGAMHGYLAKIE